MTFEGRTYTTLMGSDVERDGMYLELEDVTAGDREPVAEWFYSDADGSMKFAVYRGQVPRAVLSWFEAEARRRLPPESHAS